MSLRIIRMFPVCAAALAALLALTAAPAKAQTTVTSSGREGPTACLDQTEVDAADIPITALSATSVTYTTPTITWNEYVGRLGDTPAPARTRVFYEVFKADIGTRQAVTLNRLISGGQVNTQSVTASGLSAKTLYYVEIAVQARDADDSVILSIPVVTFARRCFMTGGTYTIPANPIASGPTQGSTGCFAISPLTQQDVRNCWCGRKTTLPLFSSTQDNTNFLNMWGCK